MLKFFRNLFSSKAPTATLPTEPVAAVNTDPGNASPEPGTQKNKLIKQIPINYNPDLTAGCKSEHQQLLGVFTEMMAAAEAGDLVTTKLKQQQLRDGLKDHFSKEFKELYVYLDYRTRTDDDKAEFERVRNFRIELQQIGVQITTIVNRHRDQLSADSLGGFIDDYKKLGEALVDRIQREETILYPLYDRYGMEVAA